MPFGFDRQGRDMNKQQKKNWIFLGVFLAVSAFLFWKCRYGIGNVDESFYLTVPYRLYRGDALFLEEWHLSQMAGVLTMPIVAAFMRITGGTEGIILAMRYVCCALQCIIGVFLYCRLKKLSWIGAVLASVSFMLYIPFGIMALSYNSMGIFFQVLSLVIVLTARTRKKLQYTLAGLFYAAAVLCCPYLVAVYFLYMAGICVWTAIKKDGELFRCALFFTLGAALAAAVFGIFVLSRASLGDIVSAFSQIMNDPEHPSISVFVRLRHYISVSFLSGKVTALTNGALLLLLAVMLPDKGRSKRRLPYFLLSAGCVFILMYINYTRDYINHLMWAVNLLALIAAVLSEKRICKRIFFTVWLPGMLYTFCLHMASNQQFYAISSASAVPAVGSILMIALFVRELIREGCPGFGKHAVLAAFCLIMTFQLGTQGISRYNSVFWESGGMEAQTQLVTQGIQKGLYVSEGQYKNYHTALENLQVLEEYSGKKVLFLSKKTWYYLTGDYEMAAYSAWLSGVNEHTVSRLQAYYALNPSKLPDAVYVDQSYQDMAELFCDLMGYSLSAVDGGYLLTK